MARQLMGQGWNGLRVRGRPDVVDKTRFATPEQRLAVLERDHFACRYCQATLTLQTANIDHVFPYRSGGQTDMRNLVAACSYCNKDKRNRTNRRPLPLDAHFQRMAEVASPVVVSQLNSPAGGGPSTP